MKLPSFKIATALAALVALLAIGPASAAAAPPDIGVKIGLPSANSWAKTLPSLTFTTKGAGLSKTCSLTGPGDYFVTEEFCSSPWRPGEVTVDGDYIYAVNVEDGDGNTAVDSVSFHVDQTAPSLSFTSAPPEGLFTNATTTGFKAAYSDPNIYSVVCRFDNVAESFCGNGTDAIANYSDFGSGEHSMSVTATDKSGNQSYIVRHFTVDRTPPSAAIVLVGGSTQTKDNTPAFVIGGDDDNGPTTKKCRIENQIDWVACNNSTWVTPDAIADGLVTAWIQVTDRAGNNSYQSYVFVLDATIPAIAITPLEGDRTTNTTPSISFSVDDVHFSSAHCGFDPTGWDQLTTCDRWTPQQPAAPLAPGTHQLWIAAEDEFGNLASSIYTFDVVATTPPPVGGGAGGGGAGSGGDQGSAAPKVTVKLKAGKVKRGKFAVKAAVTVTPKAGVSCAGKATLKVAPKVKKARPATLRVTLKQKGASCVGTAKTKFSSSLKRKKADVSFDFAGTATLGRFNVAVGSHRL